MPNSSAELNADLFEETKKMKKKKLRTTRAERRGAFSRRMRKLHLCGLWANRSYLAGFHCSRSWGATSGPGVAVVRAGWLAWPGLGGAVWQSITGSREGAKSRWEQLHAFRAWVSLRVLAHGRGSTGGRRQE
jgi:hypothetical protein